MQEPVPGALSFFRREVPWEPMEGPALRHDITAYFDAVGLDGEACTSLELALGEALANAIRYGSRGPERRPVVSVWLYRDAVIAHVRDFGPGFEPPPPPYAMPDPDANRTGGRGLPLIALLTDAFLVARNSPAEGGGESAYLIMRMPPH
jgi:anti-sigma regulatory factor (Ser/Thr protein kinase)